MRAPRGNGMGKALTRGKALTGAALVGALLLLAGCGVRGNLEPPPGTQTTQPHSGPDAKETPHRPFILDRLLR